MDDRLANRNRRGESSNHWIPDEIFQPHESKSAPWYQVQNDDVNRALAKIKTHNDELHEALSNGRFLLVHHFSQGRSEEGRKRQLAIHDEWIIRLSNDDSYLNDVMTQFARVQQELLNRLKRNNG